MKSKSRRYEVLLPLRFNDGNEVPEELLGEAVNEMVSYFGAITFYQEAAQGHWRHEESTYRDDLARLVVDVPDTVKNRRWMKAFKAKWKQLLGQLEIWMVSYPIDIE
jgi:hypothetical protein